nr:hypothetical protein [uncultured Flavobacterium sp.]
MYKLIFQSNYFSTISTKDIETMSSTLKDFNKVNGNTGISVYYNSKFLHLLESSKPISKVFFLGDLFDSKNLRIFYCGIEKEATFQSWNMVYYPDDSLQKSFEVKCFKMNLLLYLDIVRKEDEALLLFRRLVNCFFKFDDCLVLK